MKLVGRLQRGTVAHALEADQKVLSRFLFPTCNVPKLSLHCDGLGPQLLDQVLRAVIYDVSGHLVAQGEEVVLPGSAEESYRDLPFAVTGGVPLEGGNYDVGFIAGVVGEGGRYHSLPGALVTNTRVYADTYSDGASATLSAPTSSVNEDLALFATYVNAWQFPDDGELEFARLPFAEAQRKFSETGPLPEIRHAVSGWHGTFTDPEKGSVAMVNEVGPLADLVGERLLVERRGLAVRRSVVVLVHNIGNILDDMSLPRRMFMELGLPSEDAIPVKVRVLS